MIKEPEEGLTTAALLNALLGVYGVTSYALAERTGLDRSTIHRLLTGKTRRPQSETLERLLAGFPQLPPRWREELLAAAGYPPSEGEPSLQHPLQVYLSCHGDDLLDERRAVQYILSRPWVPFRLEVGDEAWPQEQAAAEVQHSDYLVMVQGWRWVALRSAEHQSVQQSRTVTALYFQKEGLPLQPEAEQFAAHVGQAKWRLFRRAGDLGKLIWQELWETVVREAREGRRVVPLQGLALIYLATRWLSGEEATLTALLERLAAAGSEDGPAPTSPPASPPPSPGEPPPSPLRQSPRSPLEPELVRIPAGWFWMGTDRLRLESAGVEWRDWMVRETPYHQVYLPDFDIARHLVTRAEFARFIEDDGYQNLAYWTVAGWQWRARFCPNPPAVVRDDYPVSGISWYEALAYCNWLKERTGLYFRLPSEAEWEKAARGTDGRIWPWGDWWDPERCNTWRQRAPYYSTPVGQYSPQGDSPYGVTDMVGNVWEWTRSLWGQSWERPDFVYPYDPDDGREDLQAGDGVLRVVRGGSWLNVQRSARCAARDRDNPRSGWDNFGFRVVVSPVSPRSAL